MYEVLDVTAMVRDIKTSHVRKRSKPMNRYHSTFLVKPGTSTKWIPADSMLKRTPEGFWEVHTPIKNRELIRRLALALDAIAYI
jgi:hypothetical protein